LQHIKTVDNLVMTVQNTAVVVIIYGRWIYNYLCNQCLSPLKLRVWKILACICVTFIIYRILRVKERQMSTCSVRFLFMLLLIFNCHVLLF
jgi:hypothetical protein